MKKLMRAVDRFCYKHPRFGLPNLMIYIVVGNLVVWLFSAMSGGSLLYYLDFDAEMIMRGQVWRLLTFLLIPQSSGIWLFISLYFYYFIGTTLERQWGSAKFTIYYLMGVFLNIIFGLLAWIIFKEPVYVDAHYLNMSMFFAFATFYPDQRVLLFFFIPIKIKWLALVDAAYFIIAIITDAFPYNLLPVVAMLNYFLFCGEDLLGHLRPVKARTSKTHINYKRAAKKIKQEQKNQPYKRKCSVCGRTDADYPSMEFRYCSRCEGYHCFCADHINNHVHFTE